MGICISAKKQLCYNALSQMSDIEVTQFMPQIWSNDPRFFMGGEGKRTTIEENNKFGMILIYKDTLDDMTWNRLLKETGFGGKVDSYRLCGVMKRFIYTKLKDRIPEYDRIIYNFSSGLESFQMRLGTRIMAKIFNTPFKNGDYKFDHYGTAPPILEGETLQRVREEIIPTGNNSVIDPFDTTPDRKMAFEVRLGMWFLSRLFSIEDKFFDTVLEEFDTELKIRIENENIQLKVAALQASIRPNVDKELETLGFFDQ